MIDVGADDELIVVDCERKEIPPFLLHALTQHTALEHCAQDIGHARANRAQRRRMSGYEMARIDELNNYQTQK